MGFVNWELLAVLVLGLWAIPPGPPHQGSYP